MFAYLMLTRLIGLGAKKSPKARNQTVTTQTLAVRRTPDNDFFFWFRLLFERTFEEGSLIYMLSDLSFNRILCFQWTEPEIYHSVNPNKCNLSKLLCWFWNCRARENRRDFENTFRWNTRLIDTISHITQWESFENIMTCSSHYEILTRNRSNYTWKYLL